MSDIARATLARVPVVYAQPPFDRVWAAFDPRRPMQTELGLEFRGRTINGWLHEEVYRMPDVAAARDFLLRDMADIVLSEERFRRARALAATD